MSAAKALRGLLTAILALSATACGAGVEATELTQVHASDTGPRITEGDLCKNSGEKYCYGGKMFACGRFFFLSPTGDLKLRPSTELAWIQSGTCP